MDFLKDFDIRNATHLNTMLTISEEVTRRLAELYNVRPGANRNETMQAIIIAAQQNPCANRTDPYNDEKKTILNFFTIPFLFRINVDGKIYCFDIFKLKEHFDKNGGEQVVKLPDNTEFKLTEPDVARFIKHYDIVAFIAKHGTDVNPFSRSAQVSVLYSIFVLSLLVAAYGAYVTVPVVVPSMAQLGAYLYSYCQMMTDDGEASASILQTLGDTMASISNSVDEKVLMAAIIVIVGCIAQSVRTRLNSTTTPI